ncbi:MAG TPA: FAD-binding oxidoreductase [Balneolales bacterium]|nr:FAD-binding oxidoreductase [Balneolales bacterium]
MEDLQIKTTEGQKKTLPKTIIKELKAKIRGSILFRSDAGYDKTRMVWNGMINRKPALIVRCRGVADVLNTIEFARSNNLLVAVRGGDHSIAGHSVCEDGLMIDLSLMRSIRVNPVKQTARAESGARWRDFDYETQAFGLATTGGTDSDTGIAGLTLGGGLGWLAGKYGLTCDNLLSADIITADGHYLTASEEKNEDLFWGLRGGSGNFGIVTSFDYRLHTVGTMLGGMVIHPFEKAKETLKFYRDFSENIPDEVNTMGILLTNPEGVRVVAIAVCYNGSLKEGEKVLRSLRKFGPPVADEIRPISYIQMQSMSKDLFPRGRQYYWKASLMNHLSDGAIDTIIRYFSTAPSPYTVLGFQQLGNAANRIDSDATAFSHREAIYDFLMLSGWEPPSKAEPNIQWTRNLYDEMLSYLHGGIYVNAFTDDDAKHGIRTAYNHKTYERLLNLKNKYDPTNFFRLNPNIKPTVEVTKGHRL